MIAGLVTTIIPVFNRGAMLREAVASVMSQSYSAIEIVIVDDGSTDDTLQVANELALANPGVIRTISTANVGPGLARNLGLDHARGEFIQYLDSDDLLEHRKFELQVRALRENQDAGVAYGVTRRLDVATGESRVWARTGEDIGDIFPSFLLARGWDTNSVLWRRSVCDEIGPWSSFQSQEDWEHDLRAGMLGVVPVRVAEHVATVRDHAGARASGIQADFSRQIAVDLFRSHESVWTRMRAAGLCDHRYLDTFSRKLFWVARICGAHQLCDEADAMLNMAMASSRSLPAKTEIRLFQLAVRSFGWAATVRNAEKARSWFRTRFEAR